MDKVNAISSPTSEIYQQLQSAVAHFNKKLFEKSLPHVLISLQRGGSSSGYLIPSRWRNIEKSNVSELALNPTFFSQQPLISLFQTIVHEQCHLWQFINGTASRAGYHNAIWAQKMEEIGLMPSHTGKFGGAKTGQKMSDYPIKGGKFVAACNDLVSEGFCLSWIEDDSVRSAEHRSAMRDHANLQKEGFASLLTIPLMDLFSLDTHLLPKVTPELMREKKIKVKYSCKKCKSNVWGKGGLLIICGLCHETYAETP